MLHFKHARTHVHTWSVAESILSSVDADFYESKNITSLKLIALDQGWWVQEIWKQLHDDRWWENTANTNEFSHIIEDP